MSKIDIELTSEDEVTEDEINDDEILGEINTPYDPKSRITYTQQF